MPAYNCLITSGKEVKLILVVSKGSGPKIATLCVYGKINIGLCSGLCCGLHWWLIFRATLNKNTWLTEAFYLILATIAKTSHRNDILNSIRSGKTPVTRIYNFWYSGYHFPKMLQGSLQVKGLLKWMCYYSKCQFRLSDFNQNTKPMIKYKVITLIFWSRHSNPRACHSLSASGGIKVYWIRGA